MGSFIGCGLCVNPVTEEEFLLLGDPQQLYGDSWLIVCTVKAKEEQFAAFNAKIEVCRPYIPNSWNYFPGLFDCYFSTFSSGRRGSKAGY